MCTQDAVEAQWKGTQQTLGAHQASFFYNKFISFFIMFT